MQYPQRSPHNLVSGMKTLGEKVIRVPCAASRTARAAAVSSWVVSVVRSTGGISRRYRTGASQGCAPPVRSVEALGLSGTRRRWW